MRFWRLRRAISLATRLATCLACATGDMLAKRIVLRPAGDCLAVTVTRLPLPPGILAFESRKVEFVSGQENIRDRIDGYPKARTVVVAIYMGWLVFFERKNGQQRDAKSCWNARANNT